MPRLASKTSGLSPPNIYLAGLSNAPLKEQSIPIFPVPKSSFIHFYFCAFLSLPTMGMLSTPHPYKHKAWAFTSYSYFFYISLTDPGLCIASPMCHYHECTKSLWLHTAKTYLGAMESWVLHRGFLSQKTITPLSGSMPGRLPSCVRTI